ncbi:MAG: bifunctional oligoribonuclease/PAP phosphatase NrnA [Candidatus Gastranaerophilales bacterium]|nr:bifunctional oligoribonuclease/PAP phosphatase NrnA [Candidatus Gastranaerophilales bacterium]
MSSEQEIINKISEAKNILIVSHVGPDGDTIGSTLALSNIIKENFKDKNVVYVIQHKLPDIYSFLPNKENITFDNREVNISCFDLAIALDCATKKRMGYFENIYNKAKFKINIDHHATNPSYADINIINPAASSCGEIIFGIADKTNLNISLDTAICLYTALLTDTGAFRYSNTKGNTLLTASKLVDKGVNPQKIYEYCFESRPVEMLKVASYAMANAKFLNNDKIAYTIVTRETLAKFNALDEHLEGIPEMLRQATSVEVAFLVKETIKNEAKFSFRSKTTDVASLCETFGGGGHKYAAGCLLDGSIDNALEKVLPEVIKLVEK